MSLAPRQCGAFTERSVPLARNGRRHMRCKHRAVTTRTYTERTLAWEAEREIALCGTHAAMFDQERGVRLRSDY